MENKLVPIDPKNFGLKDDTAKTISCVFDPLIKTMNDLEADFNGIAEESEVEITKGLCDQAHELRMKFVKIRTETAKVHKKAKEFYLRGGRFVDAIKNYQLTAAGEKENRLKHIENYFEIIEKEKIEKKHNERTKELLTKYDFHNLNNRNFGTMDDDMWDIFERGVKSSYEKKKKEEDEIRKANEIKERNQRVEIERSNELKEHYHLLNNDERGIELHTLSKKSFLKLLRKLKERDLEYKNKLAEANKKNKQLQKQLQLGSDRQSQLSEFRELGCEFSNKELSELTQKEYSIIFDRFKSKYIKAEKRYDKLADLDFIIPLKELAELTEKAWDLLFKKAKNNKAEQNRLIELKKKKDQEENEKKAIDSKSDAEKIKYIMSQINKQTQNIPDVVTIEGNNILSFILKEIQNINKYVEKKIKEINK